MHGAQGGTALVPAGLLGQAQQQAAVGRSGGSSRASDGMATIVAKTNRYPPYSNNGLRMRQAAVQAHSMLPRPSVGRLAALRSLGAALLPS